MKIPVQIIRQKGMENFSLVHWQDKGIPQRAWVPNHMIDHSGDQPMVEEPKRGVPYGLPWSKLITLSATPEDLERELKRRNIWTFDDMTAQPQAVIGALQTVYGIDYANLIQAVKENI